jgi:hypothetical protein
VLFMALLFKLLWVALAALLLCGAVAAAWLWPEPERIAGPHTHMAEVA